MNLQTNKKGAIIIEGHVQGLANTRSLGEAGIPVIIVDKENCIARYSKYCRGFYKCPDFNTEDFFIFLIQLAVQNGLKGWSLFPSNDHAVYIISKHKTELEKYYKVITPELKVINNIYSKANLLKLAERNVISIPKTEYLAHSGKIQTNLKFPVLTKGKTGLSFYKALGKKAYLSNDKNELSIQLAEIEKKYPLDQTFTQELIPYDGTNKTISFTAFCVKGEIKTCWMGVKLREHPLQFGTATFCKSIYQKECLKQSEILLKALNYTGVCEVEYLFDPRDNQYKLIEINARTWLWVGLAKACGIDYPLLIYNYLNNIKNDYSNSYINNYYWINLWTDTVYSIKALLTGKLDLFKYLKSLFIKKQFAIFSFNDIKPFFAFSLMLFFLAKRR